MTCKNCKLEMFFKISLQKYSDKKIKLKTYYCSCGNIETAPLKEINYARAKFRRVI
jgi:hypothetical protein